MKVTAQAIAQLIAEHPDLTVDGWNYQTSWGTDGLEANKWLLLTKEFEDDVQLAVDHIEVSGADASSSRIKYAIEKQNDEKQNDCHISHGAVIAAALLLGYQPVRDPRSPICTFQTKDQPCAQ